MIKLTQLVILLATFSCSGRGGSKNADYQSVDALTSVSPILEEEVIQDTFLILEKRVGKYATGDDVSSLEGLRETEVYVEEGAIEPRYVLGNDDIIFETRYDYDSENFTNEVFRIEVLDVRYKTAMGVGVGTSIEILKRKYSAVFLYYSYISGRFMLKTNDLQGVTFCLNGEGFIHRDINLQASDLVELNMSDFKLSTQVLSILVE